MTDRAERPRNPMTLMRRIHMILMGARAARWHNLTTEAQMPTTSEGRPYTECSNGHSGAAPWLGRRCRLSAGGMCGLGG